VHQQKHYDRPGHETPDGPELGMIRQFAPQDLGNSGICAEPNGDRLTDAKSSQGQPDDGEKGAGQGLSCGHLS
jgi:hypothetical protein